MVSLCWMVGLLGKVGLVVGLVFDVGLVVWCFVQMYVFEVQIYVVVCVVYVCEQVECDCCEVFDGWDLVDYDCFVVGYLFEE